MDLPSSTPAGPHIVNMDQGAITTAPTTKKRTLDEYFGQAKRPKPSPNPKGFSTCNLRATASPKPAPVQPPIHSLPLPKASLGVPGLTLLPEFVTPTEQLSVLDFLSTQPWRTDLARRTIHYGGTYCLMAPRNATATERAAIEKTIITASPIPHETQWLIDRMISHDLYKDAKRPEYCIVNEYLPGHGISAHVENFRFDEPVCSLTLGDGDFMRFHELAQPDDGSVRSGKAAKAPRTGRKKDVWLPSGSLVVLRREARWRWQHEIVRGKSKGKGEGWRRVSLTYRVEK